jgi:hypothetical protein
MGITGSRSFWVKHSCSIGVSKRCRVCRTQFNSAWRGLGLKGGRIKSTDIISRLFVQNEFMSCYGFPAAINHLCAILSIRLFECLPVDGDREFCCAQCGLA